MNQVKARLLKLNTQTSCPPRSAVLVNSRTWFHKFVSPQNVPLAFAHPHPLLSLPGRRGLFLHKELFAMTAPLG